MVYFQNTSIAPAISFAAPILNYSDNLGGIITAGQYASPQLFDLNEDNLLDLIIGKKTGELLYYQNIGTATIPSFQLLNDTLGNIDIATASPDGYPVPHFFKENNSLYLFLGGIDGKLRYYNTIESNLLSGSSFNLVSDNFLNINVGAYSSFHVNDLDQDGYLDLFVGQDLGGLYHFEVNPNSQSDVEELKNEFDLIIYPNPTDGTLTIHSEKAEVLSFIVVDLYGNEVVSKQEFTHSTNLDLTAFSNGIYLVILENGFGDRLVKRVVKK